MNPLLSIKSRRSGKVESTANIVILELINSTNKTKQLPIVAYNAFCRDFPFLNERGCRWYYSEQCAMKFMFGSKATIKFINNEY